MMELIVKSGAVTGARTGGVERIVPGGVTTSCNAAACAKPLGLVPMMLSGYMPGATESST